MPILNWLGKDKVINHHQQVPYRVLEPQYTYGQADSGNMIVHGDNLDALKALLPRFEGRVKCIYIDPPYNTGNEGWVYNDNVNDPKIKKWLGEVVGKEGEDLSRHDKWLCMMYPRLKLLQRLLSDDGAIFISIDENEQANLKLICDEIFGANNFRTMVSWQRKYSVSNNYIGIATISEYLLIYAKTADFLANLLPRTEESTARYSNPDNDPRGPWKAVDYLNQATTAKRPNLCYDIINPNNGQVIKNRTKAWKYDRVAHEKQVAENRLWWGLDGQNTTPALKLFLSEVRDGMTPHNWWPYDEVGHTQEATKELAQILTVSDEFDYPKPVRLVNRVLQLSTNKDSIILDSFAGSGTTAHAVLNMNKSDGGNRRFILVEMEEYAENITAERVKRVIGGYGNIEGSGGGFAYYELGERLLLENGNLNEALDTEKICEYVWYTETRTDYIRQDEQYLLGVRANTAYYFHYEKQRVTMLDHDFLYSIKTSAGSYLIYADINTLSADEMDAANIRFKKIPRDITRL